MNSAKHRSVTRPEVAARIANLMNEIAKIPLDQISERATIENDLRMESVHFVELQVALEDEYQVEIDAIRVVELNVFGEIVDYVHSLTLQS